MILVTGATGTVGRELVKQLAAKGVPVRALARSPQKAADLSAANVEIVTGDLSDAASLDTALRGVDRVFLNSSADPQMGQLQGNAIGAATRAGVQHLVKMSAMGTSPDSPIGITRWHAEIEKMASRSGITCTFLHPTFFMQNLLMYATSIKAEGVFHATNRDGKAAMVDARDIATVAAAVLTEDAHGGKTYPITGPTAFSYGDAAAILSEALGKPVLYVDVPPDAARQQLLGAGMPEWLVDDLLKLSEVFAGGHAAKVLTTVRDVAKVEPRDFSEFAGDYASVFMA
jgi:uncharacterized protein YbjT (DUF2867 family)